jgi:tetratricopeptide (TPR) repeat protein
LTTNVSIDTLLTEIDEAVERGALADALALSISAVEMGIRDPIVLMLAAEHYEKIGRVSHALQLLQQAASSDPNDAEVWRRMGGLMARSGMLESALDALRNSLEIEPDSYATLVIAGAVSFQFGDLRAANDFYRRAASLSSEDTELMASIALIAARLGNADEARERGAQVLKADPTSVNAHMAIARADFLEGHAMSTENRLTAMLARTDIDDRNKIAIFDLRAEVRDSLNKTSDAFADYCAHNELLARLYTPIVRKAAHERNVDQATRLASYFDRVATWPRSANDEEGNQTVKRHVFLLGFPRSGTTLLEKALASHPDVVTLEEVDHLGATGNQFLKTDEALDRLTSLSGAGLATCREQYWLGVRQSLGTNIADKIVVDKMPLHTPALPVIARLFPSAKIMFALRDPRDVVLSCFRRRFRMNVAMFEFLTLRETALYYDAVMNLAKTYRKCLALDLLEVRHEAVVANFDSELRRVLQFLGADWNPAVREFAKRARSHVRTPSDLQLTGGLSTAGLDQWCRYHTQMEPVLPILAKWVSHFGYG